MCEGFYLQPSPFRGDDALTELDEFKMLLIPLIDPSMVNLGFWNVTHVNVCVCDFLVLVHQHTHTHTYTHIHTHVRSHLISLMKSFFPPFLIHFQSSTATTNWLTFYELQANGKIILCEMIMFSFTKYYLGRVAIGTPATIPWTYTAHTHTRALARRTQLPKY